MERRTFLAGLATIAGCSQPSSTSSDGGGGPGTATASIRELKQQAHRVRYNDLIRDSDRYIDDYIHFRQASITQVLGDEEEGFQFRVYVNRGEYTWNDDVLLRWKGERFLEDDIIEFWAQYRGLVTYETVLGNERTIPDLEAIDIDLLGEDGQGTPRGSSSNLSPEAAAQEFADRISDDETIRDTDVQIVNGNEIQLSATYLGGGRSTVLNEYADLVQAGYKIGDLQIRWVISGSEVRFYLKKRYAEQYNSGEISREELSVRVLYERKWVRSNATTVDYSSLSTDFESYAWNPIYIDGVNIIEKEMNGFVTQITGAVGARDNLIIGQSYRDPRFNVSHQIECWCVPERTAKIESSSSDEVPFVVIVDFEES